MPRKSKKRQQEKAPEGRAAHVDENDAEGKHSDEHEEVGVHSEEHDADHGGEQAAGSTAVHGESRFTEGI